MNIFVLDEDPVIAAQMMCDKHIPKMIVETFQMLGSALRRHGATDEQMPLTSKGTPLIGGYKHHPATIWTGETKTKQTIRNHNCGSPGREIDSYKYKIRNHNKRINKT